MTAARCSSSTARATTTGASPRARPTPARRDEDTALREVEEETGSALRARRPGGPRRATAIRRAGAKVVHYWLMDRRRPTVADASCPTDEVDEVRWCTVPEAAELLTLRPRPQAARRSAARCAASDRLPRAPRQGRVAARALVGRRRPAPALEASGARQAARASPTSLAGDGRHRGSCRARSSGAARRSSRSRDALGLEVELVRRARRRRAARRRAAAGREGGRRDHGALHATATSLGNLLEHYARHAASRSTTTGSRRARSGCSTSSTARSTPRATRPPDS